MPNKWNLALFYLISFTWGIPMTLVGLFVLFWLYITGKEKLKIFSIAGRIIVILKNSSWGGISLGIVCIVDGNASYKTITHELGHTIQNMILGPLFILLVAIPSSLRYQFWPAYSKAYFNKHHSYPDYYKAWFEKTASRYGIYYYGEETYNKLEREHNNDI